MQKLSYLKSIQKEVIKNFCRRQKQFEFVETESGEAPIKESQLKHLIKPIEEYKVKVSQYEKHGLTRGLGEESAIPMSPVLGPIKVENPKVAVKKYRWCSCGQSLKQPFCDGRHKGTAFKPMRFILEQNCEQIELCGCKLTKNAPFCDQQTCQDIKKESC